ncbi:hypothetical protein QUW42_09330 [Desulfovibrio piger]|uniref:hypothetical protein n=1 Tax=Desulfovibrio piger TaxID=901 RepID=UPI0025A346FA|nr:hypothetical protein [Desulfovibrio piger]MDM8330481.1 hypothetical protein [Desulfovibrio piger]
MWAFLTKILPFLAPLLDKLWPSTRADELRAEAELEEARAFSRGRIAPRYIAGYVASLLFLLFGIAVLIDSAYPDFLPGSPLGALSSLVNDGWALLVTAIGNGE